jgi:IS30 family transposase
VLEKLDLKWSPEEISGGLRRTFPRQNMMQISAETIYKTLYFRNRSVQPPCLLNICAVLIAYAMENAIHAREKEAPSIS